MPVIKRWFRVSQKINLDPEVRELKRKFGLRGFSMWLEILAETDLTNGIWKGSEQQIRRILAGVCESNTRGSARVLQWVTDMGWITWQTSSDTSNRHTLKVAKHAEWYKLGEQKEKIDGKTKSSLRSEPSDPILYNPPLPPLSPFEIFWQAYPKKVGKGAAEKVWKKMRPDLQTIITAVASQKKSGAWTKDNGQFIPNPATWINQKRWLDEVGSNKPRPKTDGKAYVTQQKGKKADPEMQAKLRDLIANLTDKMAV